MVKATPTSSSGPAPWVSSSCTGAGPPVQVLPVLYPPASPAQPWPGGRHAPKGHPHPPGAPPKATANGVLLSTGWTPSRIYACLIEIGSTPPPTILLALMGGLWAL
eukprot:snap_masked-scaffold1031_size68893-processed-gene-0.11 protein:Tk03998 transcript:snap_masked-scaffold1031_size68893-processed-gene-0.11-mRNA-1 annotation:"hypothetical protein CONPUDRAFT_68205"